MRTLIQIYQDKDGSFGARNMTEILTHAEVLQCLGMVEVIKTQLLEYFEYEDMEQTEVDKVRGLID